MKTGRPIMISVLFALILSACGQNNANAQTAAEAVTAADRAELTLDLRG